MHDTNLIMLFWGFVSLLDQALHIICRQIMASSSQLCITVCRPSCRWFTALWSLSYPTECFQALKQAAGSECYFYQAVWGFGWVVFLFERWMKSLLSPACSALDTEVMDPPFTCSPTRERHSAQVMLLVLWAGMYDIEMRLMFQWTVSLFTTEGWQDLNVHLSYIPPVYTQKEGKY